MSGSMSGKGGKLDHAWRVFATGFVFVLFGLGALFISLTMFPLLRLSAWDTAVARRRIQRGMQGTFRLYMEIMRVLGILTYTVEGAERLREPGRLVVANHPTLIDVVLLVSLMPSVDCIVKRGLWRNPFLRWPVSWAGYIPNSDGEELIEGCATTLKRGHSLLVFPEGTRTVPGRPLRMQRGAAHIALAADVEILPVTITCDPPTLFKGNPWYRVPARRFHMHVVAGSPVASRDFRHGDEAPARSARRLTQWLLAYYGAQDSQDMQRPSAVASTELMTCQ
ncbi:MAG TPA: lysophospholipid acyltransferase family protein [Povalibacter sp.]|uniref:lysophospholipid acyltransferase family protein n=1 Tax=Povalibacter sp. TaxID=1962978 RepID=UPI002BF893CC|nr:lysophospholipid acyltransferase family protein [Povalibacter sp.]HMN44783.1 lysophospholipid acyltransferase family protein [Povalibacter sp.]